MKPQCTEEHSRVSKIGDKVTELPPERTSLTFDTSLHKHMDEPRGAHEYALEHGVYG